MLAYDEWLAEEVGTEKPGRFIGVRIERTDRF